MGSTLTQYLKKKYPKIELVGYDSGFFGQLFSSDDFMPEIGLSLQHFGDIRDIDESVLENVDVVIHLAGISNDPIGKEFENVTMDINRYATLRLVELSKKKEVKNFVFASSCSIYGSSNDRARKENDTKNPLTSYAQSKLGVEEDINNINLCNLIFTSLRFPTACGWSNRLRLDLVLNDFVACSISSGEITVLSDGKPWRPLIDVEDMCRAIDWAMNRKKNKGGQNLSINVGKKSINYQVKDIAKKVAKLIPETSISIGESSISDKRSYKVDFSLYEELAPDFLPMISINQSILRLKNGLLKMNFYNRNFRNSLFIRLNSLRKLIKDNRLKNDLRWKKFNH